MDSAIGWIGGLFEAFGRLFPRLLIVCATHGGVKFVMGRRVKTLAPGLHWYWPAVTEVVLWPVVRQTLNLTSQTLRTADGRTVVAGGIVVYSVSDVRKLLVQTHQPDDAIQDVALSAVKRVISTCRLTDLEQDHRGTDRQLARMLRKALRPYGVHVMQATLSDLAPCQVFKILGVGGLGRQAAE